MMEGAKCHDDCRQRWRCDALAALGMAIAGIAAAACVASRDGNLAYDDSQYVRNGIRIAHAAIESRTPLHTLAAGVLKSSPKPPLYTAWVAVGATFFPPLPNVSLLIWSTVPLFVATLMAVYAVTRRIQGARAGVIALLAYGGSACAMSLACQLWVETMLSLFVLVSLYGLTMLSLQPRGWSTVVVGVASGLGMLTKLSCAAFLAAPAMAVVALLLRRKPRLQAVAIVCACCGCLLLIAVPWYMRNWHAAIAYAKWCADFPRMLGYEELLTPWFRVRSFLGELLGFGPLAALGLSFLGCKTVESPQDIAASRFAMLFALAFLPSAILEFSGSFYEARHLMPVVPAFAVVVGMLIDSRVGPHARGARGWAPGLALAAGVIGSIVVVTNERTSHTDWKMIEVLDAVDVGRSPVQCGVIGGSYAWNTQKLELFDILGDEPRCRFTDFSTTAFLEKNWVDRLKACDVLIVVEQFDPHMQRLAPGLNDAVPRALEVAHNAGFAPCTKSWTQNCRGVTFLVRAADQ